MEVWDCELGEELCGIHPEMKAMQPVKFSRHYFTSHDALQPLLDKMTEEEWRYFSEEIRYVYPLFKTFSTYAQGYLTLTPEQKADCILKACGKWKE